MSNLIKKSKTWIVCLLILCLTICFVPTITSVFAEEKEDSKLSISDIITKDEFKKQEITSTLPFNPNFEGTTPEEMNRGWQTWGENSTGCSALPSDLTSDTEIIDSSKVNGNDNNYKYSDIGAAQGSNGMLFTNTESGVSGIETINTINIPARSLYLLTFKVKVFKIKNNYGLYVNLVEVNENITEKNLAKAQISSIKTTVEKDSEGKDTVVYVSYAFLIQGNELYDTTARLQISLGSLKTDSADAKSEQGIAALDDIRMFSLSSEQSNKLLKASNVTKASFSQLKNYNVKIANGSFNEVVNQGYDISDVQYFTPANWTQSTSLNNEQACFGVVNTNSAVFSSKFAGLLNPGLTTYQTTGDITTNYNNVLMLNNLSNTYQSVASSNIALGTGKIYELSFEFCTPAVKDTFAEETNSITFVVRDGDKTIYQQKNVYSYDEADHAKDTAIWKRLSLIIETADTAKNLTFEIIYGTESESKTGAVYVDNVKLDARSSDKAFNNIYENKLQLEGENEKFVEKGYVSLENVKNLKNNNIVSTYKYESQTTPSGGNKDDNKQDNNKNTENETNLTFLWYVIPSILLAVCTIGGIIIFYAQKIKIKPRKKVKRLSNKKKTDYDRTKNVKSVKEQKIVITKPQKSVQENEPVVKEKEITPEIAEQNLTIEQQIAQLEQDYSENKISLKKYMKQRERLEDKIMKSKEE